MSRCACRQRSFRIFSRRNPQPVPQLTQARILIVSECRSPKLVAEDREDWKVHGPGRFVLRTDDGLPLSVADLVDAEAGKPVDEEGGGIQLPCINELRVSLLAGSTRDWKISQVVAGGDRFKTDVAVGETETLTLTCRECTKGTATVTIVDKAGVEVATLGGFAICQCVP